MMSLVAPIIAIMLIITVIAVLIHQSGSQTPPAATSGSQPQACAQRATETPSIGLILPSIFARYSTERSDQPAFSRCEKMHGAGNCVLMHGVVTPV